MSQPTSHVIAIDGPSGAGKSTVARALGRRLNFLHVDSGALYRLVTWQALRKGIACEDSAALADLARDLAIEVFTREGAVGCRIEGTEPGEGLRSPQINAGVSPVSRVPAVRTRVTDCLRGMQALGDLVVEGRDIGSVVFPDSPARFYLDADPEERARRRHLEEVGKGLDQGHERVLESLLSRDRIDGSRATAPLRVADGAVVIDSTRLSIDEVLGEILSRLPDEWRAGPG